MYKCPAVKPINLHELSEIAKGLGFDCTDEQLEEFKGKFIQCTMLQIFI